MERKTFLNLVGTSFGAVLLSRCMTACVYVKDQAVLTPQDPSANKIDFTVSLQDTKFSALNNPGGFAYNRDIIIARTKAGDFIALAQYCTHQGTSVQYRTAQDDIYCANHGSKFNLKGQVVSGPASVPLKQFNTTYNAAKNELRVYES